MQVIYFCQGGRKETALPAADLWSWTLLLYAASISTTGEMARAAGVTWLAAQIEEQRKEAYSQVVVCSG